MVEEPWAKSVEEVAGECRVDLAKGLDLREVDERRGRFGPNQLREAQTRPAWRILVAQLKSLVIIILGGGAILAFVSGQHVEGIALVAVIVVNSGIGFVSEWRAVRAMEALQSTQEHTTMVRREGREQEIPAAELVPGDLVLLEAGQTVPADIRLVEAEHVRAVEAALTGESVPAGKHEESVDEEAPLAERPGMLFMGTDVAKGNAEGIVTATGMNTELGHISELAELAEDEEAPLQKRLDDLGRRFAWIVLGTAAVIAGGGLLVGQPPLLMIKTAIALGLAAVPEGAPIVATIALARGMWLMSKRQALINRLTAIETLGSTQVIFTDKTGTLTRNRMTVRKVITTEGAVEVSDNETSETRERFADAPLATRILEIGALCNGASLEEEAGKNPTGDPMEVALLEAARDFSRSRHDLLDDRPQERVVEFDPAVMMMAAFQMTKDGNYEVAVKGAPGKVLEASSTIATPDNDGGQTELTGEERNRWRERIEDAAQQGLRLLAMADRTASDRDGDPYENLRFLGLLGLEDPPATGVKDAIGHCRDAGITVNVVTGDQPETAHAIGRQTGILDDHHGMDLVLRGRELDPPGEMSDGHRREVLEARIFARVSPEQKLNLVEIFQNDGRVVAMTGDGVNDAPALKKANIGIAMGRRGAEAARQAADMILKDDAFSSIVAAVEQGRIIFANIRRSILFMLCTNGAEVVTVAAATLAGAPLPLRPLQILYLNVITDVLPALALSVGKGGGDVMHQPPRDPEEKILSKREWQAITSWSLILAACVLAAFTVALQILAVDEITAVTISFFTLACGKLWFVFNLRERGSRLLRNSIVENPWVWASIVVCIGFLLAAMYWPSLAGILKVRPLAAAGWLTALGFSLLPLLIGQVRRSVQGARHEA